MIKIMHLDSCTAYNIGQNLDYASDADRCFYDLSREVSRPALDADQLGAIVRELAGLWGYIAVANVDTNDLDVAYRQTNHIITDWTLNGDVEALVKRPRSSSVGDVFVQDGTAYVVYTQPGLTTTPVWRKFSSLGPIVRHEVEA